jgi:CheY-like chemotaxis protein
MSDICNKHQVEGVLGKYCPLLMTQNETDPFCNDDDGLGTACYAWETAEKTAHKALQPPELTLNNIAVDSFYHIDFLLAGKKILCVEDNKVSMKILVKSLGILEPLVLEAVNGQEALDILTSDGNIGLVLLDLDMPVMNGTEFMDKAFDFFGDNPPFTTVIVSELRDWDQAKKLIENGVSSQVKKPYKVEELINTIKSALYLNK